MNSPTQPKKMGGARAGAGRPPGAASRMSREARAKAEATGILPHEFLLMIVRGEPIFRMEVHPMTGEKVAVKEDYSFEDRKDAAKAVAPYYAPKISTVEVITGVSDYELDSIIARAAAEAGISVGTSGEGEEDEGTHDTGATRSKRVQLLE